MKNENQTYFSIQLESGIVISAENPVELVEYLRTLKIGLWDAFKNEDDVFWKSTYIKTHNEILDAIITIDNHLTTKQTKKGYKK